MVSRDLVPFEQSVIASSLDEFLNSQSDFARMAAAQAFLNAVDDFETERPSKDCSAMYELALYQYATILDQLHIDKDTNRTKIFFINEFVKKYFEKAGYDVDKMFER